jgi:hypothetical protein
MISEVTIVTAFIALTTPPVGVTRGATPAPQAQSPSKAKKPGSGGIGGTAGKTAEKKSKEANVLTVGTVSAVSPTSLTIHSTRGDDVTFSVDADTKVLTPGISAKAKTGSEKASRKTPAITEILKTGDTVSVRSKDADGAKHATAVTIRRGSVEK